LGDRVGQEPVRAVALALVDHRPEADLRARRVADRDRRRLGRERVDVRLVQRAGDEVTAGGDAGLALVVPRRPRADHRRLVEVGVVEHDQRVVAAELERHALELGAGDLGDAPADRAGAGEVDHLGAVVGNEPLADLLVAGDDIEHPGRQPGVGQQLGDQQAPGQRRLRRRLEDHRVAERQRRGGHAHAEDQREVPRRDHADDADRHALGDAEAAGAVGGEDLADGARGQRGRLVQLVGGAADLVLRLAGDRAGLADDQVGDLVGAGLQRGGGAAQHGGALVVAGGGPSGLSGGGGGDGGVEVLGGRDAGVRERLARGLLEHRRRGARRGRAELTGDEDRAVPVPLPRVDRHPLSSGGKRLPR
jgi:ParB family chromosome partitioning protein